MNSAFVGKKALEQSRRLGSARIGQAIELLADADLDVKGATGLPPELVVEILVARLSRQTRQTPPAGRRSSTVQPDERPRTPPCWNRPMHETLDELRRLQQLLDAGAAAAGPHLKSMLDDEHRLDAATLSTALRACGSWSWPP